MTPLSAKLLIMIAVVGCGVLARNADNHRDFVKETPSKKHSGSMLLEVAKELVQRSSSSSQVSGKSVSIVAYEFGGNQGREQSWAKCNLITNYKLRLKCNCVIDYTLFSVIVSLGS